MKPRRLFAISLAALAATSAALAAGAPAPAAPAPSPKFDPQVVLNDMDRTLDPCQDFYKYACGGWFKHATLPGDQVVWGRGFSEIDQRNRENVRALLEAAAAHPTTPDQAKLGAFYGACMDEAAVEKSGAAPIKGLLALVDGVKDAKTLMAVAGTLSAQGAGSLFSGEVAADFKNPDISILHMFQGGLGLPDRDYYLADDPRMADLRGKYVAHVAKMLELAGEKAADAKADADRVMAFETGLAKLAKPRAELRDPMKIYHRLELDGLKKSAPGLDWDAYFAAAEMSQVKEINVATPEFFVGLDKQVASADAATLRAYLRWHVVSSAAPALSKPFVDESFNFYARALRGQKENAPRWKRCGAMTNFAFGELLGKIYVETYFPGDSKAKARDMVLRVENAFGAGLASLDWMDDATRAAAKGKLAAVANKIGYPDKWIDYGPVEVKKDDFFGNLKRAGLFLHRREAKKLGQKVDRAEWGMTPPTVNAYYNPSWNEMVFPAGILQPPFFDRSFPMAMNFGGMGLVMGHELTHGFDDEGRMFDAGGTMKEWWAAAVSEKFTQKAACIENLYTSYEIQPGVHVNGKLTLGENIADFGGLKSSFNAFQQWKKENPGAPAVAGLTDDQLFFVGFAQTWCQLATPEVERERVKTDPHSPAMFRVNGPLSNFPAFAATFACKEGTPMHRADTCAVW